MLWNGTRVPKKFDTKVKAEVFVRRRKGFTCEIQERTYDNKFVDSWTYHIPLH